MPPSFKFTKEEIIDTATELVKEKGIDALTARALAVELGSSPKPIFGLFEGMEEVKTAVLNNANEIYQLHIKDSMESLKYPKYKASGMAYISFALTQKELFKLLFMRNRSNETIPQNKEEIAPIIEILKENLNINEEKAYLFHLEMWIFVHGIATMAVTSYLEWDLDFISRSLTDIYEGLKHRFREEE